MTNFVEDRHSSDFWHNSDNLHKAAWLWAIFEAERGWHFIDEYLYLKAKKRELTAYDVQVFANFYSVSRTISLHPKEENAQIKQEKMGKLYNGIATLLNKMPEEAPALSIHNELQKIIRQFVGDKSTRTFCAKLVWFFDPDGWMMHDSLSRLGLKMLNNRLSTNKIKDDFQVCFAETFSSQNIQTIEDAIQEAGLQYQFPRRVIDKYLFLIGSSDIEAGSPWICWLNWQIDKKLAQHEPLGINLAFENLAALPHPSI
ncbi:hypothetical protein [Thalassospira xiamenensis]|uniref:Uncharacterized protein n=1 Tax=Thalassospira xiamenensis TaxID=220697 RepID=A0A367X5U2_9PROT|nr:hypothetical protein [Thalassospira xiamenensis]KZB51405.1 hypothetical protein AUP41_06640 [Thalassospira xiamenensis]RCK48062.1 hypothetical protein TH44_16115 [Thalassospira xiamenensis]